jgi:hypothetical protein
MFCHQSNPESVQGKDRTDESNGASTINKRRVGALAAAATLTTLVAPHTLCLIAGIGAAGGLGWGIHSACSNHSSTSEALADVQVGLPLMPEIPDDANRFSAERNSEAKELLLRLEPEFQKIIDVKQAEANGVPVQLVFLKSAEEVSVVVCVNGEFCPCKEPQIYRLGTEGEMAQTRFAPLLRPLFGER